MLSSCRWLEEVSVARRQHGREDRAGQQPRDPSAGPEPSTPKVGPIGSTSFSVHPVDGEQQLFLAQDPTSSWLLEDILPGRLPLQPQQF